MPVTPAVDPGAPDSGPLPHADVLIVTWTDDEALALSRVLSPGVDATRWCAYTHNFAAFAPRLARGAPAAEAGNLGRFWQTKVGTRTAVLLKSSLHLDRDGPATPIFDWWRQVITECDPELVISTGTAGGVGVATALGDVVVTTSARFDCQRAFRSQPWADAHYVAPMPARPRWLTAAATELLAVNAARLPIEPTAGAPVVIMGPRASVLTTDFFCFDTADDHYGLRELDPSARAVEMGDAALAQVATDTHRPYLLVRNASDPCIPVLATVAAEDADAGEIYTRWGFTTSIGSAVVCWAYLAGDQR